MFLIFTFLRTRKSLCEAHTSHLFSFFQDTASPSLIRHTTTSSQILLVKEGKQYFQRECLLCTFGFQEAPCFPFSMFDKTFPRFCLVILKRFFSFSVCLFKFVLDEESKLLKPTQSCFLLELIREGQDKGCLFRFSDVHSQRLLLNFHFHHIKDYFHFHNIKDYFNFHNVSFTLSKSWLQLFV